MIQWKTGKKYWKYDVRFIFNEERDYSEENTSDNEDFRSTIFNHFSLSLNRKKRVEMRAMRKKQNIFTLQLSIVANAGIAKTKREKQIVFVVERQRWMQCLLIRIKSHNAREASCHQFLWATALRVGLIYPGVAKQN